MKWMSHQRNQSEKHDLNKSSSSVFFGFGDEVLNEIPEQNEEPTDRIPSRKPSSSKTLEYSTKAAEKEESPVIPSNSSDREKHHKNSIQPSTTKSTRETDQMSAKGQERTLKKTPEVFQQKETTTSTENQTEKSSKEDNHDDLPMEVLDSISSKERIQKKINFRYEIHTLCTNSY